MVSSDRLIDAIQSAIIAWYDFRPGSRVLSIGAADSPVGRYLARLDIDCEFLAAEELFRGETAGTARYDYIVSIEDLELATDIDLALARLRALLMPSGRLLLGMNNRLGIRYFCGDRDPYTARNFDGIEDYRRAYASRADRFRGRLYSRGEIEDLLTRAGFIAPCFYTVVSDLRNASFIYREDYLPNEDLAGRVQPTYNYPATVFLEEEFLYSTLAREGLFHRLGNAFFIECALDGTHSAVLNVTSSLDRGPEQATITTIMDDGTVIKRAPFAEGQARIAELAANQAALKARGIAVVEGRITARGYEMPYIPYESALVYLKRLLATDRDEFYLALDSHRADLMRSADTVGETDDGIILATGYWDMVPWNAFCHEGRFIYYDQELALASYPLDAIFMRTIMMCFDGEGGVGATTTRAEALARYGLTPERVDRFSRMTWDVLRGLRLEDELFSYHGQVRRDVGALNANRQRLNYSVDDYQRLFIDIFDQTEGRDIYLFGSGRWADRFLALYGADYPVKAVIDNNKSRQGETIGGVAIVAPEVLLDLPKGSYKVIVCIKNYLSVMEQLAAMGIASYALFDPSKSYRRREKAPIEAAPPTAVKKRYHVGYIAGVFDLIHVGHLNMFRRAKEQCDYLIVGVVSDEGVTRFKQVEPFIPEAERLEMVRACRYVDRAELIPTSYGGTEDAWRMYHFDVQFSGSDYEHDPAWLREREFLQAHGADLVFFPYTQQTSSTRIKSLITKKLV